MTALGAAVTSAPPVSAPASTWVPAPPSSFSTTGTVTYSVIDAGPMGGDHPQYALFVPQWQHIVQNQNGIFSTYNYISDDLSSSPNGAWRLKRSTSTDVDGTYNGSTWTLLYDSLVQGQSKSEKPPAVETDASGNVYVFVQGYGTYTGSITNWKMYKFSPPSYTLASTTTLPTGARAAGKYSVTFDQGRQWFWIVTWADPPINIGAYDLSGALVYSKQFWNAQATATHASAFYPNIDVAADGTIFVSWTTYDFHLGLQNYYDIHLIWSTDNGTTWKGEAGNTMTLPMSQDDVGTSSNRGVQIVDTSSANEFIDATSPNYSSAAGHFNWNMNSGMGYVGGRLHCYYASQGSASPTVHNPYARFNPTTVAIEKRISPAFTAKLSTIDPTLYTMGSGAGGNFPRLSTQSGRLYFVGQGNPATGDIVKVVAFYSDDNGDNWYRYAIGSAFSSADMYFINTCRWVQTDGSIIGSVYLTTDASIRFFRIKPN